MRQQWVFLLATTSTPAAPEWRWQIAETDSGSVGRRSALAFGSLYDCIKDAEREGYTGFRDLQRSHHAILLS